MHGIVGLLPVGQVATRITAVGGGDLQIVIVVDVALCAGHVGVTIRQRESGARVVKGGGVPTRVVVAGAAGSQWESLGGTRVRRIVRLLPGGQVAARISAVVIRNTRKVVVVVDVALRANERRVRTIEDESGHAVIEGRAEPTVKLRVAVLAIRGSESRTGTGVRRIVGLLPVAQVAGLTVGRKAVENSGGSLFVTLFALHGSVSAEEREAIQVIFDLLHRNIPALHGVTLLTGRAQLMAVDVFVRVTIDAVLADVGEDRLDVVLVALHFFVHATKRIPCFVVVKFGNRTDRTPARGGVTILTGNLQRRPVWAARGEFLRLRGRRGPRSFGRLTRNLRIPAESRNGQERPERELKDRQRRPSPIPPLGARLLEERKESRHY